MRLRALALIGALSACGPVRSTSTIVDAAAELAAAETAQARELSPYEMLAAEAYLHKAREEQSYSDFEISESLAKKSRDCSRVARARAEKFIRQDLGANDSGAVVTATCLAGPAGARPPQGLDAPAGALPSKPAKKPADAPKEAPKPDAPKKPVTPEPADPVLPEGE